MGRRTPVVGRAGAGDPRRRRRGGRRPAADRPAGRRALPAHDVPAGPGRGGRRPRRQPARGRTRAAREDRRPAPPRARARDHGQRRPRGSAGLRGQHRDRRRQACRRVRRASTCGWSATTQARRPCWSPPPVAARGTRSPSATCRRSRTATSACSCSTARSSAQCYGGPVVTTSGSGPRSPRPSSTARRPTHRLALAPTLAAGTGSCWPALDVIAGRLIEVNVTCPGGMHKTDALLGTDLSGDSHAPPPPPRKGSPMSNITVISIALMGILIFVLGANVTRHRVQRGATGNQQPTDPADRMYIAQRAHGNASEYVPTLIGLLIVCSVLTDGWWLDALSVAAVAARAPARGRPADGQDAGQPRSRPGHRRTGHLRWSGSRSGSPRSSRCDRVDPCRDRRPRSTSSRSTSATWPWSARRRRYVEQVAAAGARPVLLPGRDGCRPARRGGRPGAHRRWRRGPPALRRRRRKPAIDVDPARDETRSSLVRAAAEPGMPLLGVCRGLQVLAVAFGGTLTGDLGHEPRASRRHATRSRTRPGSLIQSVLGDRPDVTALHHQAVAEPGPSLARDGLDRRRRGRGHRVAGFAALAGARCPVAPRARGQRPASGCSAGWRERPVGPPTGRHIQDSAPGGDRTHTESLLRRVPLPVGIRGRRRRVISRSPCIMAAARPSTSSSIASVSLPVNVFCWLG